LKAEHIRNHIHLYPFFVLFLEIWFTRFFIHLYPIGF
jgi:hypothetical protein